VLEGGVRRSGAGSTVRMWRSNSHGNMGVAAPTSSTWTSLGIINRYILHHYTIKSLIEIIPTI
jgi:hypothetical protein